MPGRLAVGRQNLNLDRGFDSSPGRKGQKMPEVIRVRCPICGAMPTLDNLEQTAAEKPAEIRIFIQRFGGKAQVEKVEGEIPKKKGRGKAPGYMEYIDVTEQYSEQVEKMEQFFNDRIKEYQGGKE